MSAILSVILAGSLLGAAPAAPVQRVTIVGGEYAFTIPADIRAGRTSFRFVNRGKARHELSIALLKSGATLQQYLAARESKSRPGQLLEVSVGVLFADAGETGGATLGTTLLPGRDYLVICGSKDSVSAPEHSMLGMYSTIHVPESADSSTVALPADTIVATDYAFQLPAAPRAGPHAFAFTNRGTQRHELKVFLLPRGQTLRAFMTEHEAWRANRARGGSISSPALAVLVGGPGITPRGVVELRLAPGREYAFTCDFADRPDAPPHTALGMFGGIRVVSRR